MARRTESEGHPFQAAAQTWEEDNLPHGRFQDLWGHPPGVVCHPRPVLGQVYLNVFHTCEPFQGPLHAAGSETAEHATDEQVYVAVIRRRFERRVKDAGRRCNSEILQLHREPEPSIDFRLS